MEWVIIAAVPVLIIAWKYLWTQSKPPQRHVMTDVRGELADRLQSLAAEAREKNRHKEAQQLEYQAKWLRIRPTDVGGDEPPEVLLGKEERHVRFAGAVWDEYGMFLAKMEREGQDSVAKPQSVLPYPKEGIEAALELLLNIGEGRTSCSFIDSRSIPPEAMDNLKEALIRLDGFTETGLAE